MVIGSMARISDLYLIGLLGSGAGATMFHGTLTKLSQRGPFGAFALDVVLSLDAINSTASSSGVQTRLAMCFG